MVGRWTLNRVDITLASKLRAAGVYARVDDSGASIGKRYARNDELGSPYGCTLDFACECTTGINHARERVLIGHGTLMTAVQNGTMTLRLVSSLLMPL